MDEENKKNKGVIDTDDNVDMDEENFEDESDSYDEDSQDDNDDGRYSNQESDLVPKASLIKWKKDAKQQKAEVKRLQAEIDSLSRSSSSSQSVSADIAVLAEKEGLSVDFVNKLVSMAKGESEKLLKSQLEKQQAETQQIKIDNAFNNEFNKLVSEFPEMESKKEAIKQLAFSKPYQKKTLTEIAEEVFGFTSAKSSEDESFSRSENGEIKVDFEELRKNPEKRKQVFDKNPEARQKFYDWADKQGY